MQGIDDLLHTGYIVRTQYLLTAGQRRRDVRGAPHAVAAAGDALASVRLSLGKSGPSDGDPACERYGSGGDQVK